MIDILTSLVLDYTVVSKYCHACSIKETEVGSHNDPEFQRWYADHQEDCCADYEGSSNTMEVESAKRLWGQSLEMHHMRYTGMLGDGDSKAFDAVQELVPYPGVTIMCEECVNHAHNWLGTALLKLSKTAKLGGKGHGRLTKKALWLQQYYCAAIAQHTGDADGMRNAVWATFHCLHEYGWGPASQQMPHWHRVLVFLSACLGCWGGAWSSCNCPQTSSSACRRGHAARVQAHEWPQPAEASGQGEDAKSQWMSSSDDGLGRRAWQAEDCMGFHPVWGTGKGEEGERQEERKLEWADQLQTEGQTYAAGAF